LAFLASLSSPRADEFRIKCDARFPLSTIFKSSEEQARLREAVKKFMKDEQNVDGEKAEVAS
jgi:peptide alpha-N-acetyltransferase